MSTAAVGKTQICVLTAKERGPHGHAQPVALRIAGSASVEVGQKFANIVSAPGTAPDLSAMWPDESALVVALLWIKTTDSIRRPRRARQKIEAAIQKLEPAI